MNFKSEEICRICLATGKQVVNLITSKYLDKLQVCVPTLNISESDPYSKNICESCVHLLDKAFELYQLCLESGKKFREEIVECLIKVETKIEYEPSDSDSESKPLLNIQQPSINLAVAKSTKRCLVTRNKSVKRVLDTGENTVSPSKIRTRRKFEDGERIGKKRIPKYECDICGRRACGKADLEEHIRVHTRERPFVCEFCGKAYTTIVYYRLHLDSHNPNREKNFKCTICSYRTVSKRYLKRHAVTHTGERPYSCNLCSKKFTRDSGLYNHMKNIHLTPSYSCQFCGEKFNFERGLRRHIIIHYRAEQYGCPECIKIYATHEGLVRHMKRVHPGIPWPKEKDALLSNVSTSDHNEKAVN